MKIAILGSAPSSLHKAPFGDPSWKIWACSPGCYPALGRIDEFWEVHRWEPGVVGKAATQKPWFTPEYVQWLGSVPPVLWVSDPDALRANPNNGKMLPIRDLVAKFGSYCWTSSVAYMAAQAIDRIQGERLERDAAYAAYVEKATAAGEPIKAMEPVEDAIAFFGVDMAANDEMYTGQRSACQFFIQVIAGLGIKFVIPPESDLATPPPMYGVSETSHRAIKWLERRRELEGRLNQINAQLAGLAGQKQFLEGALDDIDYFQKMWLFDGEETLAFDFEKVFPEIGAGRAAIESERAVKIAALPVPAEAVPEPVSMEHATTIGSVASDLPSTGSTTDI